MDEECLDTAERIAATLCRDAIRDGGRCNWIGPATEPFGGRMRELHRSLHGDLYGGTGGIALFLAEADRFRPDPLLRCTARAAIEHALACAATMPGPLGFYTGATGIGFAAVRIGEITGEEPLVARGLALLKAASAVEETSPVEVLSGVAGIIGPLLALYSRHGDEWLVDRARAAGDLLLRRGRRSAHGVSWNVLGDDWTSADLTGYAHGTAGIALALFELAWATGEERYAAHAEGALAYERACFSPQHQNWPDFRCTGAGTAPPGPAYSLGWCHGAPGVGLGRLRAYRFLPGETILEEILAALSGTYAPLATLAPAETFALCHGAAGRAELFIEAGEILGDPGYTAIAEAIARQGMERYHHPRRPWPCGVTGSGEPPSLMRGLAGIGYFYLRLYDPKSVPSALVVGPDHPGRPAESI